MQCCKANSVTFVPYRSPDAPICPNLNAKVIKNKQGAGSPEKVFRIEYLGHFSLQTILHFLTFLPLQFLGPGNPLPFFLDGLHLSPIVEVLPSIVCLGYALSES